MNKLFDFHTHTTNNKQLDYYIDNNINCLLNCYSLEQFNQLYDVSLNHKNIKLSVGTHPSFLKEYDLLKYKLEYANVIGEIGMDDLWSVEDLHKQAQIFVKQLNKAKELNKPVILHTKGMEGFIAEVLQDYELVCIVHWFSGDINDLKKLNDLGCYFTLGPDYRTNVNTHNVLDIVSWDKILIETDGLGALEWAYDKKCDLEEISNTLSNSIDYICKYKNVSKEDYLKHLDNFFNKL
ncbi:MAG: TatD family hydrolase [Mycoplasmatales bacterium]